MQAGFLKQKFVRLTLAVGLSVAMLGGVFSISGTASANHKPGHYGPNDKMTICHRPPGNPSNAQTLEISGNAWQAHQQHGDTQGPCPTPTPKKKK